MDEENIAVIYKSSLCELEKLKSNLSKDHNNYYIGETYSASYKLTRKVKQLAVRLDTSSDEITLKLGTKLVSNGSTVKTDGIESTLIISFKPISLDIKKEKRFEIFVSVPQYSTKYPEESLLKKTFKVKEKVVNKPRIDGKINKALPTSMKLGQKAEVIFLFTNSGEQSVHGINIEVKQIEA